MNAYGKARETLESRFGNKFIVGDAFKVKLSSWPNVKERDSEGLQRYADFFNQCLLAKDKVPRLATLDDCEELLKLARKLPEWARLKWRSVAAEYKFRNGVYPACN